MSLSEGNDPGDPSRLKYSIQSLEPIAGGALARVSVTIGEPPGQELTIRLSRRGAKWMIADVISEEGSLLERGRSIVLFDLTGLSFGWRRRHRCNPSHRAR